MIQWDSDFVSATLSTDIIYHGVASFPSLTSLDLFINTAPHLCWMHRLHRIFLALRHHHIRKLQVEIADFANSNFDTMPKILRNPPIPYYCLTNLDHLRISVNSDHGIPPLWLGHFDRLILANKTTLTSLSVNMDRLSIHPSRTPFTQVGVVSMNLLASMLMRTLPRTIYSRSFRNSSSWRSWNSENLDIALG